MDCAKVTRNIRTGLKSYIIGNDIKSLVIGVSGGADSAACCALARAVCDELGVPLIGRSIPIETNKPDEIKRALIVGEAFCHDFKEVDLTGLYHVTKSTFEDAMLDTDIDKIAQGNIKARLRMQLLYATAGMSRGMVLSTDNLTEYYLGFFTLCGDVGDFGMVQFAWKTEVYHLMEYLHSIERIKKRQEGILSCRIAIPTDGLGISSSDLDQIGAGSYDEVEVILKTWLTKDKDSFLWDEELRWEEWSGFEKRPEKYADFVKFRETFKDHPVVLRYEKTHFKRNWPIGLSRQKLFSN